MFILSYSKDYTGFDGNPTLSGKLWQKQENLSEGKKIRGFLCKHFHIKSQRNEVEMFIKKAHNKKYNVCFKEEESS
jgi:hypothetical protein